MAEASFHVGVPLYNFRGLTKNLFFLNLAELQWEGSPVSPPASGQAGCLGAIYVLIDMYTLCRISREAALAMMLQRSSCLER